jgi:hypothetical protein
VRKWSVGFKRCGENTLEMIDEACRVLLSGSAVCKFLIVSQSAVC